MAKISSYTFANPPTLGSYVIGTLNVNSKDTKNFRISDIINLVNLDTFSDIGDSTNPITTIDLSLARTTKVRITGNTQLNFINQEVGGVYIILPYIDQAITPNVSFSSNVLFSDNTPISILPGKNIDTSFVSGSGFSGEVYSIAVQPDGKILVVGIFTSYQGVSSNRIIRLNTDGSIDTSFVVGSGFNSNPQSIAVQPDGKILVGGIFTSYQGVSSNRIIRLNTDGSIDTSFVVGTGFNSNPSSIAVQPDGKILVGGFFSTYQGVSSNKIIRLNTNGSIDTSFVVGSGFNGSTVNSIAIQADGKILAGGSFSTYQGVLSNNIIRLNTDGSIDTSFVSGSGFNSFVNSIVIQSDGKILVGGSFSTYQEVLSNNIIRLNTDGSIDTSFVSGSGFNSSVPSIVIQSDGKILVGGSFSTYQGVSSNKIIRLNTDGSIDTSFYIGTGFNSSVNSIAIQADGKILVGGFFVSYQGVTANRIIRLLQIPNDIYYKIDMVSDGVNLIAK